MKEFRRAFSKYSNAVLTGDIQRLTELANRSIKSYIAKPNERKIYFDLESLPTCFVRTGSVLTKIQPKQVSIYSPENLAFVTCMEGNTLQIFDYSSNTPQLTDEIKFEEQCVESTVFMDHCFITSTNFEIGPKAKNRLSILDINTRKIISVINTNGNWSKVIAIHPTGNELMISNWESNSISVVDITNLENPKVTQVIKRSKETWKCPRGVAYTADGNKALVTGFYSGNITELNKNRSGQWDIDHVGNKFDSPNYSGNLRHIIIDNDSEIAFVSNVGRNMIHSWSIRDRKFINSVLVGKEPNTIDFFDDQHKTLLISCRADDKICLFDTQNQILVGKSETTDKKPTGLATIKDGFLATSFDSNKLEKYIFNG